MASAYERRAAALLQPILGGSVAWRDVPGAAPNTHDFDMCFPDGRTAAVEVTRVTDQDQRAFWAAVHKQDWQVRSLRRSWALVLVPSIQVNALRVQIERHLADLEQCQVCEFGLRKPVPEGADTAVRQLAALAGC